MNNDTITLLPNELTVVRNWLQSVQNAKTLDDLPSISLLYFLGGPFDGHRRTLILYRQLRSCQITYERNGQYDLARAFGNSLPTVIVNLPPEMRV